MNNEQEKIAITYNESNEWYTEEFIYNSVVKHLIENNYKIHKEESAGDERKDTVIVASRYFTKEIIHVKGATPESSRTKLLKAAASTAFHSTSIISSFTDVIFNSLVNFGKYYSDDNSDLAMALPNVDRYTSIIERLKEYFSTNNLSLKIYLVNQDGQVEISNLNIH